jgi:hypothetical protein
MKRRSRKLTAAIVAVALVVAVVPAVVVASIITNATAVAVKVSAKLKATTNAVLTGSTGPLAGLVTTCTASATGFTLTTKGGGLGPFTLTNPTFTGCTDNLGGTDTIKSNSTNGPWTDTYINSTGSPNPDLIKINIPKAGQTLVSSIAPACTLTLDPAAAGSISGTYDNAGNLQVTNQTLNYSAAGTCPTGTGSGTAHFSTALKSGATGNPGYVVTPPVFGIH